MTTTRLRFCVTAAVFSSCFRPLLAGLAASGAVNPRARVTSVASEAAWPAAASSVGAISSTLRLSAPPQRRQRRRNAGDDGRVGFKRQREAEDADGAAL